jgi:hypothetical protein
MKSTWPVNLYLLNFALLFTHEIDSAFWKEWELFGIPGGVQVFLILNLLLLLIALFGFKELLEGSKIGRMFPILLAIIGIFAFFIHSYFIIMGHSEFTLPMSLAILISILIVSVAQGLLGLKDLLG